MISEKIIFHIDDDADDRFFFSEALSEFPDLAIQGFSSFEEALRAAKNQKIDAIYMDFWVPGMTATQFLKSLSDTADLSRVPINVLSGTEVPLFFREVLDHYNVKYLVKPNSTQVLKSMLLRDFLQDTE